MFFTSFFRYSNVGTAKIIILTIRYRVEYFKDIFFPEFVLFKKKKLKTIPKYLIIRIRYLLVSLFVQLKN